MVKYWVQWSMVRMETASFFPWLEYITINWSLQVNIWPIGVRHWLKDIVIREIPCGLILVIMVQVGIMVAITVGKVYP